MITALALSPSLDMTYVVAEHHGIQRPLQVHRVAGGKALNAARAATALGARTAAVAVLAGGIGQDVATLARRAGVDLRTVDGAHPTRVCISILADATGELSEIYEQAVPLSPEELDAALATARDMDRGWWSISGGIPDTLGPEAVARAVATLREAGNRVAVDTHGDALRAAVGASPDLVKVNRSEAVALLGVDLDLPGADLVSRLHEVSGTVAVVTDGAEGAYATDGTAIWRARVAGHRGRFPVGSGDSFQGGLLVGLDGGGSLPEAIALATGAGTANAQVPGAAVLSPQLTREIAGEVEISETAR